MCTTSKKTAAFVHTYPHRTGLLPTIAVTLWLGVNGFLMYLLMAMVFLMDNFQRSITIGLLTILALLPLPKSTNHHKLGYLVGDWIARQGAHYFGLTLTVENPEALRKIKKANTGLIFGSEPHNILPYPIFAFNDALSIVPHVRNCFGMMCT